MKKNGFKLTKKGIIALAVLIILLAGAIWLNTRLNGENPADGGSADGTSAPGKDGASGTNVSTVGGNANIYSSYFANFRDERNLVRAQEIEYLRMILAEEGSDAETVQNAKERLMELVSNMEQEFAIESLIRAKGFLDAAVTLRSDAISVIIDGETLSDEEVARILDIVQTETGAEASKIKISLSRG